jgi:hypothetical protein
MPTYFQGSLAGLVSSAGLTNPYSLTPSVSSSDAGNCCCPSSTKFLETLTDKLIDMTNSLKTQFAELVRPLPVTGRGGFLIASVSVSASVSVRREYLIYLDRYGPPMAGVFDSVYLDLIRAELAAGII